jgi:hypothetical protein
VVRTVAEGSTSTARKAAAFMTHRTGSGGWKETPDFGH